MQLRECSLQWGGFMVRGDPADQERTIARANRRWRELLRRRGAVWQWRIGKEPLPRFAKRKPPNMAFGFAAQGASMRHIAA